jgi:hypothetical protein
VQQIRIEISAPGNPLSYDPIKGLGEFNLKMVMSAAPKLQRFGHKLCRIRDFLQAFAVSGPRRRSLIALLVLGNPTRYIGNRVQQML